MPPKLLGLLGDEHLRESVFGDKPRIFDAWKCLSRDLKGSAPEDTGVYVTLRISQLPAYLCISYNEWIISLTFKRAGMA